MNTQKDDKIVNRESWAKIILSGIVIITIIYKILNNTINVQISNLDVSDFLSIMLAFFAISLSVLFYFKATETSNTFYNNTYNFTKTIGEVLGRMESGFGEKLKHIEDYTSTNFKNQENTKKEIEQEERQLQKAEKEKTKLIEDLANKAKLEKQEKNQFITKLIHKDQEISVLREEIHNLRNKYNSNSLLDVDSNTYNKIRNFMNKALTLEDMIKLGGGYKNISLKELNDIMLKFPNEYIEIMRHNGIITVDGKITDKGLEFMKRVTKIR